MKVLVTGCAGFIGFHVCLRLIQEGMTVIGVDNCNSYYDPNIKVDRLAVIKDADPSFTFTHLDISNPAVVHDFFSNHAGFDIVVHLAAQAGVRYSLEKPFDYIDANVTGFLSILESCRRFPVQHLVYASSSSVYGANTKVPFSEDDPVVQPVSLYAVTKRSNELMAHTYSNLFGIPTTGLRFFTVYGPWGRPDMAYWSFTKSIIAGSPIPVFGGGKLSRDFTYIDDIVESIFRLLNKAPAGLVPARILNIGKSEPVSVDALIQTIERALALKAEKIFSEKPLGDVECTYADSSKLNELTGFKPATSIEHGIQKFVSWFKSYAK